MDNYPEEFTPIITGNGFEDKEPFVPWWERVGPSFPNVPKNVGRQWIWRHWGASDFRWLPTESAKFELMEYSPAQIAGVKFWRRTEEENLEFGKHLLSLGLNPNRQFRPRLCSIMARTYRWPAPPIVWDRYKGHPDEPWDDLVEGHNLVEGHRRMEMAKALVADDLITENQLVWLLRYK